MAEKISGIFDIQSRYKHSEILVTKKQGKCLKLLGGPKSHSYLYGTVND
jgi:hypothetical protein